MELKFISQHRNKIYFSCKDGKFIGIPLQSYFANEFRQSTIKHLQEAILEKELPENLRSVTIDYVFKEKDYFIKWVSYFNSGPSESEILTSIFGYVTADMPNITNPDILFKVEEEYLFEPYPNPLKKLKDWAYIKVE